MKNEKEYPNRRITRKISKMGWEQQVWVYFAKTPPYWLYQMTKKCPKLEKFYMLLEAVDLDVPIGHLFVADIDFNFEKTTAKIIVQWDLHDDFWETKKCFLQLKNKSCNYQKHCE